VKVAIVTESFLPQLNGVTNSVIRVARHLRDSGHSPFIVAPTRPGPEFEGIPVHLVPSIPLVRFQVGIPSPALARILDSIRADIIHVASPFALGAGALAYAQRMNTPSVAIYQTDVSGYLERYGAGLARPMVDAFVTATHNAATLTLAPTASAKTMLRDLGVKSVKQWGRGVDLTTFHPNKRFSEDTSAFRAAYAPNGERIIGYVGRLAAEKQVNRFTELLGIPNSRIVIVGEGPERTKLERMLPSEHVSFAGSLSGDALGTAYAAMDVFVHFGEEETFGQTIQEAHAAGVPVIAPRAGGPIHLIESGVDGFLFEVDNRDEPAELVARLLSNDVERLSMGEMGRRRVRTRSWDSVNAELLKHYSTARKRTRNHALA
jgi:phosphatidylinositol alpha 1,6-mannosyltransferase